MGKRTGSAYWDDKKQSWRIDVQKNGIRKSFYCSTPGRAGKRTCHDKADAWLDEGITDTRRKIKDMAVLYMDELKATTSQSHWRQYENYIDNYICKMIGNVSMEDLTEQHFQNVINKAFQQGKAKKTLENMRACEKNFLKFCRKCKATTLLCEDIRIPKGAEKSEKIILQPDDIRKLFQCDSVVIRGKEHTEHFIYAFRFAVITGMRPGEIVGLQRRDITDNVVHIKRSVNYYGETTAGKNDNARRTFKLSALAQQLIVEQGKFMASKGILSPYVFPGETGEAAKQQTYAKHLKNFCEQHEITAATPYELRHTFVSIAKSLPMGTLKALVGHSEDMDTLGIYGHAVEGDLDRAAEEVNELFNDILTEPETAPDESESAV